ncbi:glycosyl hydrolase family 18 [Colletotrichum graminicola]|uniref:chitinase n=1 Tax=Colletotrichum graminicola (strain M1.001 / M2 / FGSC 10212) TaxID=645133 RepID=E3QLW2_COLGM|nr:glycosyl hydrolase family 18 [Colletotrichum graminicola M1.001]EFQ31850.1 glycosyl hydrolase family 18 [Colletotrichum graminicola M1.001]WDK21720.1 glycosyl hydrolase family 18 [Colletotrichum graminicola]
MAKYRALFPYFSLVFILSLIAPIHAQDIPICSASVPCEDGCCNKSGLCGLGPDYCSKSTCVNNCDRKAQCDPGGFGEDYVVKTTCPLNVCCSEYGYCGTTETSCGNNRANRPSCPVEENSSFKRVVGYYETWATGRACNRFFPEQIPAGVYSHINIAFISINPSTFELVPAEKGDVDLYKRVANLKAEDPHLKVLIAVGGTDFHNTGPTAATFSDIARSQEAQKKFTDSVLNFMSTYGLDGIDLDWEYPGVEDRGGRVEDFANLPKFVKTLRQGLKDYEISVTIPAIYLNLQHFDLKNIEPHVDFFNVMAYDFHGVWNKPTELGGPYFSSHTNLTEIKDGLDLLWRNNVNHDKVVLGLAFYGRGFQASDSSCLRPGCTFESGSDAQPCSGEDGAALNSEIDDLVAKQGTKSTLDTDAAVKVLTWGGDNWLTYDDEETFRLKADFARSQCLGGVMVWAISQDTENAKYSKALSRVAPRISGSQ